jgi:hypothetical protein
VSQKSGEIQLHLIKKEYDVLSRKRLSVKISLVSKDTLVFHSGRILIVSIHEIKAFWNLRDAPAGKRISGNIMEVISKE